MLLAAVARSLTAMTKRLRNKSAWIAALCVLGTVAFLLLAILRSEVPRVTLHFENVTNSVAAGKVGRFTIINYGKRSVQRLPLYVVQFDDSTQLVITVAAPAVILPGSQQRIEVPLPQSGASWRHGISCSPAGPRARFRDWWDSSRRQPSPTGAQAGVVTRITSRALGFLVRRFHADYVYVQSEWIDHQRSDKLQNEATTPAGGFTVTQVAVAHLG